ncbi:MAG: DMT family transporter [Alphaproteobacteria bacterium]
MTNNKTGMAIIVTLLAFVAFAISDGLRKFASQDYAILDIIFWQAVCGFVVICIIAPFMGGYRPLFNTKIIKWHLLRGCLFALNTTFSLQAISRIPIMDAYTIFFLTPFVASLFAVLIFKESIGKYRGISILFGFIGAFIAFRPGFEAVNPAYIYAISCVFLFSMATVIARYIGNDNGMLSFAFWPFLCLIFGIIIYKGGQIPTLHSIEFLMYMLVIGAAYGAALILISYGYTLAEVAVVAPYQYVQIILALGIDYFVWASVPDIYKIIGSFIIVGAGVFLFIREGMDKKKRLTVIEEHK